jgi:hypothetical protein
VFGYSSEKRNCAQTLGFPPKNESFSFAFCSIVAQKTNHFFDGIIEILYINIL